MSQRNSKPVFSFFLVTFCVAFFGFGPCFTRFGVAEDTASETPPDRPNLLFILADDLGYGDLGVLWQNSISGSKRFATPNLDRMAHEGLILNQHYTAAPVCAPARGSLFSGVHQGHCTIRNTDFDNALEHNHTLATTLAQAGYATALIGKYGMQGSGKSPTQWSAYPTKRGFDFFHGYVRHVDGHQHYPANNWPIGDSKNHRSPRELYENDQEISADLDKCFTPDLFTARAKKWLVDHQATKAEQAFFLFLAYDTPHAALQLPTSSYPPGVGTSGGVQWIGKPGQMINTARGEVDSWRHPDYVGKGWTDEEVRFATLVRRMDDCVGDLLATLRDLKIDDNTLVIFTADNGPHAENYISGGKYEANAFDSFGPFEGTKRDCYEGGMRQPTFAWWPNQIAPGQTNNTPSQFQDWMATFCDLAGHVTPARCDGVSLVPLLTGVGEKRDGIVYTEFNHNGQAPKYPEFTHHAGDPRGNQQVIFIDGYKGIRNGIRSHADDFQIYDVHNDLAEANDLFRKENNDRPAYFASLQQRMKDRVLGARQIEKDDPFDPSSDKVESRPYDAELVPAVKLEVTSGVQVDAYEGRWNWVPQFAELKPLSTKQVATIDVASDLPRSYDAGLCYRGLLKVPSDGQWSFYATSDAGTHLRIHESQVIDDDFNHDGSEASGSILLKKGLHPFTLYYRTAQDKPILKLQWSGPGTSKQSIPDSSLFRGKQR
ncbi:Arylsulfatase precursor [Novipirellula aureliae]|uniref:Arylsulfatase n=1 Tax=Novipirellula aureliae TaxID=2527966 RepID=A0A5C6E353_9BACT|nr:sulfatase-like hydrolase/transferase [Novipirellula aureliae]TWU43155.1 Arylsulfatase precursor [Novipirellula aureliae]